MLNLFLTGLDNFFLIIKDNWFDWHKHCTLCAFRIFTQQKKNHCQFDVEKGNA